MKKKFIEEFNEHTNSKFSLEYKKCLYSGKSKFQKIEVFDTIGFGKTLLLDSCFMVTEKDHHLYHNKCKELIGLKKRKLNILIIGGGDFGLVKTLSASDNIIKITVLEIDQQVIEVCKKYFPSFFQFPKKFKNKVETSICDGYKWVKNNRNNIFDAIIVDCTDPNVLSKKLYSSDFYNNIFKNLKKNGLLIQQSGSPLTDRKKIINPMIKKLEKTGFSDITLNVFPMPSYPLGTWSFVRCIKRND